MKILKAGEIGSDGGKYEVGVEGKDLKVSAMYPVEKILQPVKEKFVDKIKKTIPGEWDDKLIDKAWQEAVELLHEDPALPEAPQA